MAPLIRFAEAVGVLALVVLAVGFGLWGALWLVVRWIASGDR